MNHLLPKTPTGNGGFQFWLERLKEAVRSSKILASPDIVPTVTSQGTFLSLRPRSGTGGSTLAQYRLKEIGADWLRCRKYDGTTEGTEDVYIARDPELRRTPFDGQTIAWDSDGDAFSATYAYSSHTKRTKTVSGTAETQVIVPYYKVDFTVVLAATSANKTGVLDPNGAAIYLVEITQRAWAKLEA